MGYCKYVMAQYGRLLTGGPTLYVKINVYYWKTKLLFLIYCYF